MLKQYKLVSIIYGGSGARYADEMNRLILQRSEAERYPITSKIVMESVLTGDLLNSITDLFTKTEYCLAFLTADDCCLCGENKVLRLRQNVVFELGMAIYRLGRERCILLSDFDPSDSKVELPSDLKGVDIKYFSPEDREVVFNSVLEKILKLSSKENHGDIPQYDKLLEREEHFVDYDELFSSSSVLDNKEDAYLKTVLNHWLYECRSFEHFEERCLHFLERIGFISMFGRNKWVVDFLLGIQEITSAYRKQDIDYCGKKRVAFLHNLTDVVRSYVLLKCNDDHPEAYEYTQLLDRLMMESAENSGVKNPLALTVYYDYLGLLNLHLFELSGNCQNLSEATKYFRLVVEDYADNTDLGLKIWPGFLHYNLARCYLLQYNHDKNTENAQNAQKYFSSACVIRKSWLGKGNFHQAIRSALSYEYFICKIDEINLQSLLKRKSDEEIVQEYRRLESELEGYMLKSEQLERLLFVQELLTKRQKQLDLNAPLSEDVL